MADRRACTSFPQKRQVLRATLGKKNQAEEKGTDSDSGIVCEEERTPQPRMPFEHTLGPEENGGDAALDKKWHGRQRSPCGSDGTIMTCSICKSEEHPRRFPMPPKASRPMVDAFWRGTGLYEDAYVPLASIFRELDLTSEDRM